MSTPAPETIHVDAHADQVKCDGGNGALGHPLIYLSFASSDTVECGYCDRKFVKTGQPPNIPA